MKRITVLILSTLCFAFLFIGFINGPAKRGHDKTGSPLSNGQCMNCHATGSFSPNLMIKMFDGDVETDRYEPGKSYRLEYQLLNSGSPAVFGFQTVVLNDNNETTGTFDSIPAGFQLIELNGANYVEHSSPRPLSFFSVYWKAPENTEDAITVYAGGVAANGNGNTGGDGGDISSIILQPGISGVKNSDIAEIPLFSLRSTLIDQELIMNIRDQQSVYNLSVFDQSGSLLKQSNLKGAYTMPLTELHRGMYFVRFIQNGQTLTERFFKI